MEDTVGIDFMRSNGLQDRSGAIGVDRFANAIDPHYYPATMVLPLPKLHLLTSNTFVHEMELLSVKLILDRRLSGSKFSHKNTDVLMDCVDGSDGPAGNFVTIGSRQAHFKQVHELPDLGIADFWNGAFISFHQSFQEVTCVQHTVAS